MEQQSYMPSIFVDFIRLLFHTKQKGGNCKILYATSILQIPNTAAKESNEIVDASLLQKFNIDPANLALNSH